MATQEMPLMHQPHYNGSVSGPLSDLKITEPSKEHLNGQRYPDDYTESTATAKTPPTRHDVSASMSLEEGALSDAPYEHPMRDRGISPSQDRPSDMQYAPISNPPAMGQVCR